MIKNYFKVAFRNLYRNKTFSVIKIAGLSIGLSVCMLILLYAKDEVSYDRFHENQKQLYRVAQSWQIGNEEATKLGVTNMLFGETFKREIPEIVEFVRLNELIVIVKTNNDAITESSVLVDENFFSVFTFPLLEGNPNTALKDPQSIVLSEEMAKKYFGKTNVLGEKLQIKLKDEFEEFIVSAVAANPPQNSTIKFKILMPFQNYKNLNGSDPNAWLGASLNTFLLLNKNANKKFVEGKISNVFAEYSKPEVAKFKKDAGITMKVGVSLQPLTDIHLNTEIGPSLGLVDGSTSLYTYILSSIAFFILLIACINFINLAIAQSLKRSKEIGIRKVMGSSRKQLIKQFLTESFIVSSAAFIIAVILTLIFLPFFNQLTNKKLSFFYLTDSSLIISYFLLLLVTSFIAGYYPSLVLSAFQPVKVLYSRVKLMGKNYFTRSLIVLQFALAIFLIIGTLVLHSQLSFLFNKELGYDSRNLVSIELPDNIESNNIVERFKNELEKQPSIIKVTAKNKGRRTVGVKIEGKELDTEYNKADKDFLSTFKIPILAGRNFSSDFPTDVTEAAIVNETFIKEAGWTNDAAIGKSITLLPGENKLTITGVIKDYHFSSLKEKIMPQVLTMDTTMSYGELWVKVKSDDIPKTLSLLQNTYKNIFPWFPYGYQFMDDLNARNLESELKWKQMISIASVLFIFISCLGLFGLVILSIEQRTKEISIRKVLGASISKIIILISRDFLILISIAFVVAVPISYFFGSQWLQLFPYRINLHWWMFVVPGIIVIAIAFITISLQTIKAALANPVKALRTE